MKLSRIDQIALNGATGEHYKYEEVAALILAKVYEMDSLEYADFLMQDAIALILVEAFPNDA